MAQRVFVISDLHMAAKGTGFFSAKAALTQFILHIKDVPGEVDLVILGDALDYLQIEPYLSFTAAEAEKKTEAIIANNQEVFSALQEFIAEPGKRIRWVIGNHDLELLFPIARQLIAEELFGKAASSKHPQLTWHLDGGHIDYLEAQPALIRLVHGNQGDGWNAVDYDAAKAAVRSGSGNKSVYPHGSVLVAEVLNPLQQQGFHHVHMLKPETTVALPLSIALWPEDAWRLICKAFPLFAKKKQTDLRDWLVEKFGLVSKKTFGPPQSEAPQDSASIEQLVAALLKQSIAASGSPLNSALASDLSGWLTNQNAQKLLDDYLADTEKSQSPKYGTFGWMKNSVSSLVQGAANIVNGISNPWVIDQEDDLRDPVQQSYKINQVTVLIAGHTHLARTVSYPGGYYINTGTWADLMKIPRCLPSHEFKDYARDLRENLKNPAKCPFGVRPFQRLTYVEIDFRKTAHPFRASLCEWPTEASRILHQYP